MFAENPDGWDFEASTAYHRLVLDCLLTAAIFVERTGTPMPEQFRSRIFKMGEFVRDIVRDDGSFPLIGDNDSGLLIILQPDRTYRIDHILALCSSWLYKPELKPRGLTVSPECLWLLGEEGVGNFQKLAPQPRPTTGSYPHGGLWIFRLNDEKDLCTFRLGPVGQKGNGGHGHNDQLSVTLTIDNRPVIVDSGVACYTSDPEKRNRFRSVKSHATIVISDIEHNRFVEGNLFTLPQEVSFRKGEIKTEKDGISVEGTLLGYGPYGADEIRITRLVKFNSERKHFEIRDRIELAEKLSEIPIAWYFPIAPGLRVESSGTGHLNLVDDSSTFNVSILFLAGWKFEMLQTTFAPGYGEEVPNITLKFTPPPGTIESHFIIRSIASRA
ncbi:MAG: heparinase II/III-family protein [bacterium]